MGLFTKKDEYNYFECFLNFARAASKSAKCLDETFNRFDVAIVPERVAEMHEIENDADNLKHEMMSRLAHEFIPPIELEDIAALGGELDNVIDAIEDVIRRIYMFDVRELRDEALEFTELIVRCCEVFEEVVTEFADFKKSKTIHERIIQVNTLESDGDRVHERALRRLFTEGADTRTLLVWMNLFESLESCLDAIENAADVIESVVMKNT